MFRAVKSFNDERLCIAIFVTFYVVHALLFDPALRKDIGVLTL